MPYNSLFLPRFSHFFLNKYSRNYHKSLVYFHSFEIFNSDNVCQCSHSFYRGEDFSEELTLLFLLTPPQIIYCGPKVCIHGFIKMILSGHLRNQTHDIELFQGLVKYLELINCKYHMNICMKSPEYCI